MTCAIHRYSMGVCVKCGEAPLGSYEVPAPAAIEASEMLWPFRYDKVNVGEWTTEFALCTECDRVFRWEGTNEKTRLANDCSHSLWALKCVNEAKKP